MAEKIDKKYKLDLFRLLEALDKRDFNFYKNLSDEEKKGLAPIVALRWMSCVPDRDQDLCEYFLQITNEANAYFWAPEISKHPELQYLSLAICGIGSKMRHEWIKGPSKKKSNKILDLLKRYYPTASKEELEMFFNMNTVDDFIEIGKMLGLQDDELKEIKKVAKELKK